VLYEVNSRGSLRIDEAARRAFDVCAQARDETVLFVHTGGPPSVFAYADVLLGARAVDA
jgi:hypothetical protein